MKRVAVFGSIAQFEAFVNDTKVSVIDVKVSTCEQSYNFQECFVGVVFYEDAPQNTMELAATDNQHTQAKIAPFEILWKNLVTTMPFPPDDKMECAKWYSEQVYDIVAAQLSAVR